MQGTVFGISSLANQERSLVMNKRIISLLMSAVMILSILVTAVPVYAASDNGLNITVTEGSVGDTFTVTLNIPAVSNVLESIEFRVTFDNTAFEVTETPVFTGLSLSEMPTVDEVNAAGFFSASLFGTDIVLAEKSSLIANFRVKDGAEAGPHNFTIARASATYSDEETGLPVYALTLNDFDPKTVTYTVKKVTPATAVTVTPSTLTLIEGDTAALTATLTPADSTDIVTWFSSNDSIAIVDESGLVTAVAVGEATITAKANDTVSANCAVTVEKAPCTHVNKTEHPAEESTCITLGHNLYYTCDDCSKVFKADGVTETTVEAETFTEYGEHVEETPATCTALAVCSVCHQPYGELAPHDYKTEWNKGDVNGHWHDCKNCSAHDEPQAHIPGAEATEDTPQLCIECGYVVTPATGHIKHTADTSKWLYDANQHWHKCVGCDEKLDIENHHGGEATCTARAICEDCGQAYGKLAAHVDNDGDGICDECESNMHEHDYSNKWTVNEEKHWHECICGDRADEAVHTASNWIVDKKATTTSVGKRHIECTICGYVMVSEDIPVKDSSDWSFDFDEWYRQVMLLMNQKFTVTATAGVGGSITDEGKTKVKYNDGITYTITPDDGYEIDSVMVDGKYAGRDNEYTFKRVRENHTIEVRFREITWDNPFVDVFDTDTYYEAIEYVYENGLFKGVSETEFAPDTTMTRAMFVTVLGRLAGVDVELYETSSFDDVELGTWYAPYVEWAVSEGIVNGYGDGRFGVDNKITVEQTVVIMARYAEYIGIDTDAVAKLSAYSDAEEISEWAINQMKWAVSEDIYNGVDEMLNPKSYAKRSLVAEILYAFANKFGE